MTDHEARPPSGARMVVRAPAKINLFLRVKGRRADGYHDLVTLLCPVGLYDTVTLELEKPETTVVCTHPEVPSDGTNLAARAADLFFRESPVGRAGVKRGVAISIDKKIPVAAGLGGGSSDAAAVLTALDRWYGNPVSGERLQRMGARLGADVPFFIGGTPALAMGIGDRLSPFRSLPPLHALLVHPPIPVSTAQVYKNLNLALTNCEKVTKNWPLNGQGFDAGRHLCNDLETVTARICPDVLTAKEALLDHGAIGALMSGSGPCVFGLFEDETAARRVKEAMPLSRWRLYPAPLLVRPSETIRRGRP